MCLLPEGRAAAVHLHSWVGMLSVSNKAGSTAGAVKQHKEGHIGT